MFSSPSAILQARSHWLLWFKPCIGVSLTLDSLLFRCSLVGIWLWRLASLLLFLFWYACWSRVFCPSILLSICRLWLFEWSCRLIVLLWPLLSWFSSCGSEGAPTLGCPITLHLLLLTWTPWVPSLRIFYRWLLLNFPLQLVPCHPRNLGIWCVGVLSPICRITVWGIAEIKRLRLTISGGCRSALVPLVLISCRSWGLVVSSWEGVDLSGDFNGVAHFYQCH